MELFRQGHGFTHQRVSGYAQLAGLFAQVRAARGRDAVVALDNGDSLDGTFVAVQSQGEAMIEPLNRLALDAWTVHWDIAYGPERLRTLAAKLDHPLLALNCYHAESDTRPYPPARVIERGGVKIGTIGLAATIIDKTFPPAFSHGLRFTLGRDELPAQIRHLRQEQAAELVIVLGHLGFPQACQLARDVDGIDLFLSGHTHNRLYKPVVVNGTRIIQSGCHASFVGRLDLTIEGKEENATISKVDHRLITLDETIEPDPAMQALVADRYAPHAQSLAEIVGETETLLHRYSNLEAPMDNLLLDAIADAAELEVAFSNGWRYGAPILPGAITQNDLWNIIPTNPPVSTVELSGAEILAMMEENLERTFAADPYAQMGGYVKRCRGINLAVKIENPSGTRIQTCFTQGERLARDGIYPVAFVTAQGVPERYGRRRQTLDVSAIDALRHYLAKQGRIKADLRDTVMAV